MEILKKIKVQLLGHCKLSKDPHPQWRTISWNQQSTVIAFSESDGTVHVCDIKGIVIFTHIAV